MKKPVNKQSLGEKVVKDIRRATRKKYSTEEKSRNLLDGLKGEHSIAELCRREGNVQVIYYKWSKGIMRAQDLTDTLDLALQASGCDQVHVIQKPRLLRDNGSNYVSVDLAECLKDKGIKPSRGAPHHPQTQGKIER